MGRHDLPVSLSRRSEVITPTIVDAVAADAKRGGGKFSQNALDKMGVTAVTDSFVLAKSIVDGVKTVATIKAESEREIKKIAKEIDRITAEAKAYVEKSRADSDAWHRKFDDRQKMVSMFLSRLDSNPDFPLEVKVKIVDAAIASIAMT